MKEFVIIFIVAMFVTSMLNGLNTGSAAATRGEDSVYGTQVDQSPGTATPPSQSQSVPGS